MSAGFSEEERIEALGQCLGDSLDHVGLYEIETDEDFVLLVELLENVISGFRCHHWSNDKPDALSMVVEVPELWLAGAIERALLGRGPEEESIWISTTTVQ